MILYFYVSRCELISDTVEVAKFIKNQSMYIMMNFFYKYTYILEITVNNNQ